MRDLIEATFVASTTFFGLFVLSAAASGRARRVLPAWLAWFGVAVGVLTAAAGAVGAVSLVSHTPLPYMAALTWTVVVSVFLAARPTGQGAGAAPSAAPGQVDLAGTV